MRILLLVVALIASSHGKSLSKTELSKYVNVFSPYKSEIKLWLNNLMFERDTSIYPRADFITCDICQVIYPVICDNVNGGATDESIVEGIIGLCIALNIETADICGPLVRSYGAPILYIVRNRPEMTVQDFCGIINPGCTPVNEDLTNWEIFIDDKKPPVQTLPELPSQLKTSKILQFTDIHIDVNYTVGTNAGCGKALCCREGIPDSEEDAAQEFGDYRCALPPKAFEAMLDNAQTAHGDIKYIFLTGDYVHSGVWLYSEEENSRHIRYLTQTLAEKFPNTPIYPLTGNHEVAPVNMYPPPELWDEFDLNWMYDLVAEPFSKWLGTEQLATFKRGGYYTIKPEPGLRFFIVNTNLCYINNYWLAFDPHDPTGQLQWLADTMLEAEQDGDNVFILGHIPVGSGSCWPVWSQHFDRIVNRFENIIRGQFYGHHHTENFNLAFERGTERATSLSFSAPSGVTDGMNSGYKVYLVDGERGVESTWEIADHETWILNTTRSNIDGAAVFEKLFSAKKYYGLKSIRPGELYNFVLRMLVDDHLFLKFERNYNKGYTTRTVCNVTGDDFQNCKLGILCEAVTSHSGDTFNCDKLEEMNSKLF